MNRGARKDHHELSNFHMFTIPHSLGSIQNETTPWHLGVLALDELALISSSLSSLTQLPVAT